MCIPGNYGVSVGKLSRLDRQRPPKLILEPGPLRARPEASIGAENGSCVPAPLRYGSRDMLRWRRFKQRISPKDRLASFAKEARKRAELMAPRAEREDLLRTARQATPRSIQTIGPTPRDCSRRNEADRPEGLDEYSVRLVSVLGRRLTP